MTEQTETAAPAAKVKKDREAETVKMEDGREVEFVGKRKMLKDSQFDSDGNWTGTRFDFRDSRSILFVAPELDKKLSNGIFALAQFAAHGAEQKIGDETAGEEKVGDMYEAVLELTERLTGGDWTKERTGGGMGGTSILIKALVESSGKSIEAIRAFLKGKDKAAKDALRLSPRLKPIVERLEQEELAKSAHVNTEALFGELDAVA